MKRLLSGVILLWLAAPVQASPDTVNDLFRGGGIVVDQTPCQACGGPGSDTQFRDSHGFEVWQQLADNILLAEAAIIRRVTWWGFYGGYEQNHEPPTGPETMRIRFYDARPSDDLPGEILYDESFLNPSRTATGEIILVGGAPDEYLYEVDLATPVELGAETMYWLEIVQLGDVDSTFRWEDGFGTQDGHAYVNLYVPDWALSPSGSQAFQLSAIPEPSALVLLLIGLVSLKPKRGRKERPRS